ncbi:MAG: phosphoglycerate dehydrogenase [Nitrososphaeria archaeon]
MNKPRMVITSKSYGVYCKDALKILERFAVVERKAVITGEEMGAVLRDCDAIILGNEKLGREDLLAANRLRIIARHGVGVDNVDLDAATERGIVVTYTPQSNSDSVAEYTIMLMLNILKNFHKGSSELLKGNWARYLGFELMGKTVGIVGFGAIGRRVAKKLSGFDVRILAYDPFVKEEDIRLCGAIPVSLEELLRSSDIVTLHVSLSPETRHLLNKEMLKLMKKTAFLINASRGSIVDEKALYESLEAKDIAGAALDVFEQEPVQRDNPILKLDNVVLSPHMANFTIEALTRMDMMNAEDLRRFFCGERPLYVANPKVFEDRG